MILYHKQSGKRRRSDEAQHSESDPSLPALNILVMQHLKAKVRNLQRWPIMYRSIPKPPMPPPPRQTPGHLTFLKNFVQIPCYVASLDSQMPHPLELQRGSNPPPSRHVKANCGNKFCKIFNHYELLVQLVFVPHFKQRHIPR